MRTLNRKVVFDHIVMRGPISRVDLSSVLGLSRTAVTDLTADLLERDLLRESGPGESAGGRRPVLLEAFSETSCVLGIEVSADELRAVAADPGGRILATQVAEAPSDADSFSVVQAIHSAVEKLRDEADAGPTRDARRRAYAVGIAWSGLVAADGSVTSPDIPGCEQKPLPLLRLLSNVLDIPIVIDNDANLGALAELRYGAGRDHRHLAYLLAHAGLGAGIVADGRLYRGHEGAAGEIGHLLFDPNGQRCECGNYGCLETVASTRALARYLAEGVRFGRPSELAGALERRENVSAAQIISAAHRGDSAAVAALEQATECLGIAAANVANTYAPELVVLGGPFALVGEEFLQRLRSVAKQRTLAAKVDFEVSQLNEDGPALGACAAATDELLISDEAFATAAKSESEKEVSHG